MDDDFENALGRPIDELEQEVYELMHFISDCSDGTAKRESIAYTNEILRKIKEAGFKTGYSFKTNVGDTRFIEFDAISSPNALNDKVWVNLMHPKKQISRHMVERSKRASLMGRVLFPPSLEANQVSFETPENILNTMDGAAFQIKRDYKSV